MRIGQFRAIEGVVSEVRQAPTPARLNREYGLAWGSFENWGASDVGGNSYECLFSLSGKPVALRVSDPIFLKSGETVRVVGRYNRNGVFEALGYYNRSSGVSGTCAGALFERLLYNWFLVTIGLLATTPFTAYYMSRFFRDDHMVVDSLIAVCAVLGLPLVLIGWVMFEQYQSKIRAIESLLKGP